MTRTRHTIRTIAAFAAAGSLVLAACGGDDDAAEPTTTEAADDAAGDDAGADDTTADIAAGGAADCAVDEIDGDLLLYNWSDYMDPDLIEKFEATYDVTVIEDFYDSNEAMQPIISAGRSGYDVIVPSDYMVSIMIEDGTLMPLNKSAIPNYANLADEFRSGLPYDPAGAFVAPYQFGTTGLGVNLDVVGDDAPRSWALVFDPELSEAWSGQISLLNDPRETLGAALKYLGYSLNSTDPAELEEARDLVADAVSRIAAFDSDQYSNLLVSGETAVAHGYSGNLISNIDDLDGFTYFVPDEGGTIWIDNMGVVFDAPHPCTAHTFINFILDGENGAQLTEWILYGSPNAAAYEFLDPDLLNDERIFPDDTSMYEVIVDTGDYETNFSDAFSEAKG
jgi:spermidine/putrescine-binding protein